MNALRSLVFTGKSCQWDGIGTEERCGGSIVGGGISGVDGEIGKESGKCIKQMQVMRSADGYGYENGDDEVGNGEDNDKNGDVDEDDDNDGDNNSDEDGDNDDDDNSDGDGDNNWDNIGDKYAYNTVDEYYLKSSVNKPVIISDSTVEEFISECDKAVLNNGLVLKDIGKKVLNDCNDKVVLNNVDGVNINDDGCKENHNLNRDKTHNNDDISHNSGDSSENNGTFIRTNNVLPSHDNGGIMVIIAVMSVKEIKHNHSTFFAGYNIV